MGPQPPPDALRAAGTRVIKQGLGQHRTLVVLLVVITLLGVGTTLLIPSALAAAIDAASTGRELTRALVQLGVLLTLALALDVLDDLISDYYGSYQTAGFRHRLLGRAMALGVPGQRRFPAGDLLSRLTVNTGTLATFLPILLSAVTNLLVTVGAVVGLALIDLRLAGTFLLGVPVAVAMLRLLIVKAGGPFARYQQLLAAILTRLLDALRGVRTIQASGTADREIGRILSPLPELNEIGRQVWAVQRRASWQVGLLGPMLQVLVLSVGGFALTAGDITAGQFVAGASYVMLALGSIRLVDTLISLLGCQVGIGRVGEVLESTPATPSPAQPVPIPPGPGRLELRDVTVRVDERTILDHLDLSVPPGTSVAVVGESGAGKSVLVSLIGRLIDPDEGTVLLEGVSVCRVELPALRQVVTYAFERPALLGSCVHDLIAYGRPEATRAEVEAAAGAAQADRFIRLLPEGYDTPLTRAPMSGGELQRLGLAQTILTKARVIVLDDATSSLDTATEVKVVAALERILAGRTCVVVAYRTSTAARSDLVAWLDDGRIRALAPHAELWADASYRATFGVDADPGAAEEPAVVVEAGARA